MKRIIKIGMDVHSTSYTLCAAELLLDGGINVLAIAEVAPDYKNILKFIASLKQRFSDELMIVCGYEAGCLGYTLFRQLNNAGITCIILAPSTMMSPAGKRIKTDRRDAHMIAHCMACGGYSPVHVPNASEEAVRDYIRMRDDHLTARTKVKQQINCFCLRHGFNYDGKKWNQKHRNWLKGIQIYDLNRETLDEYLLTLQYHEEKIDRFDKRIEELASADEYREKTGRLCCFLGIKTHTALSFITETGDFSRFVNGSVYSSYLGLCPGERSSGDRTKRTRITKAGNMHLRSLAVEAAQSICRGAVGYKSKALKARQNGNDPMVIEYADKANERLRRKYHRLIHKGKPRNVAVAAVARELTCFIWGMMTENIA